MGEGVGDNIDLEAAVASPDGDDSGGDACPNGRFGGGGIGDGCGREST
jgi:hypothetical protein